MRRWHVLAWLVLPLVACLDPLEVETTDTTAMVAGETRRPALVTHPERGGTLPETAQVSRPWRDVQLVVLSAEDDRALVEVRAKPLVSLVWLGAVLMTLGAAVGRAVTRSRRQGSVSASPGASFASPD